MTNIYDVLKNDHNVVKVLLDKLVSASEKNQETDELLTQIGDEIVPHARAEEAVLYNTLRDHKEAKGLVMHGYREHMEAEALLRTLQGLKVINIEWTAAVKKLKESLLHHIEEEEGAIFDAAKKVFHQQEAKQMATAFQQLKLKAKEQGGLKNTLDMVVNIMPKMSSPDKGKTKREKFTDKHQAEVY